MALDEVVSILVACVDSDVASFLSRNTYSDYDDLVAQIKKRYGKSESQIKH